MNKPNEHDDNRPAFLVTGTCMAGGLVAGYGTLAAMAAAAVAALIDGILSRPEHRWTHSSAADANDVTPN
jgi:hypothetical protein